MICQSRNAEFVMMNFMTKKKLYNSLAIKIMLFIIIAQRGGLLFKKYVLYVELNLINIIFLQREKLAARFI